VFEPDVKSVVEGLSAPAVFIDTYTSEGNIVNVGIDDYKGGYLSAKYLINRGHRKIALASPEYKLPGVINERYKGFADACHEAGVSFDENDILKVNTIYQDAISVGQDTALSGKGYTAIAAMSDMIAFGLTEGLKQCGVSVPDDISIIGFDNIPEGVLMTPKLTTMEQDLMAKAAKAVDYLFRMIEGETDLKTDDRLPIRIKERQSVRTLQ
jgi:LacI family transcriptional regulator